jgi:hypothetical protein
MVLDCHTEGIATIAEIATLAGIQVQQTMRSLLKN